MTHKRLFALALTSFFVLILFISFNINSVNADTAAKKYYDGMISTADDAGYEIQNRSKTDILEIVGLVIRIILSFLGVIFLLLIIYGGYTWMMARGNEQEVDKARKIIQNALIGLIIVLAAYAITALMEIFWLETQKGESSTPINP